MDVNFYPTSERVGKLMLKELEPLHMTRVLEPSAGDGALLDMLPDELLGTDCWELDPDLRMILESKGYEPDVDFLLAEPMPVFNRIIMNPPFPRQEWIRHVHHAIKFLAPNGRLVSLAPKAEIGRFYYKDAWIKDIPKGRGVHRGSVKVVMVIINKGGEDA